MRGSAVRVMANAWRTSFSRPPRVRSQVATSETRVASHLCRLGLLSVTDYFLYVAPTVHVSKKRENKRKKRKEKRDKAKEKNKEQGPCSGPVRRAARFGLWSCARRVPRDTPPLLPTSRCATVAFLTLHSFQHLWSAALSHFSTPFQLCVIVWIVLILHFSAAYPKLHRFLRWADFVPPGNRSSNLSQVPPVGCRSPLCAW
jgi:hypothetical protein